MLAVHNTVHAPPTPPYTSTFLSRTTTTLPPIASLAMQPLTPPDDTRDVDMPHSKPTTPHHVDWLDFTRSRSSHFLAEKTCEMICYLWHANSSTSPSAHIPTLSGANAYPSPSNSPPNSAHPPTSRPQPSTTNSRQLNVSPGFVAFVHKLLETTQVSQSVIVLSLHYIYKVKANTGAHGSSLSEFRVAVAALMMANKFLDDNTYTNKTWADVSCMDLKAINEMEKDFLQGIDYNLYVDKATYEAWLNLLKGLVMAKERDMLRAREQHKRKRRQIGRAVVHGQIHTPGRTRFYRTPGNGACVFPGHISQTQQTPRARSTSPIFLHSLPSHTVSQPVFRQLPPIQPQLPLSSSPSAHSMQPQASHNYRPTSYTYSPSPAPSSLKRSAATAFSPTSASFSLVPTKKTGVSAMDVLPPITTSVQHVAQQRPGITLQIPHDQRSLSHSNSPLDNLPLMGFAKLNLDSAGPVPPSTSGAYTSTSSSLSSALGPMPGELEREREQERKRQTRMTALVQPFSYSVDDQRRNEVPRNLYFYTLACSPPEDIPSGTSRPPSPTPVYQLQDVYEVSREIALEHERELRLERERELERERQLAAEKERERERERQRKARLRVHRPAPASTIRYSDYAYMPYMPSNGVTNHSVNGPPQSGAPSLIVRAPPTNSTFTGHTQSARTSPAIENIGRHFDAVRFEVERTQGYAPSSDPYHPRQISSQTQAQSQKYYDHSEPVLPSQVPISSQYTRKSQGRNPYPKLSPPTPATSTSTSPVTLAPRNVSYHSRADRGSPYTGYGNRGHGTSPYSSLAGANTYAYERSCASAYSSPAFDPRRYSPPNHLNGSSLPPVGYSQYTLGPTACTARDELAYAQAQAQHQKTAPQQYDSPGVPTAPFANAGPSGVHQMQYYSVPPVTSVAGRSGYGYAGFNAYSNGSFGFGR